MSGTGPESIPMSADPRSKRPTKKRALDPVSAQASHLTTLFARPDQDIRIPPSAQELLRRRNQHLAAPPEIVTNVQGSSAGAGSGEFHVYKAARRRENERLRVMDEETRVEEAQRAFEAHKVAREEEDRARTERNRLKREKMKARKDKAKAGKKGGGKQQQADASAVSGTGGGAVKARAVGMTSKDDEDAVEENGTKDVNTRSDRAAAPVAAATDAPGLLIHDDDD